MPPPDWPEFPSWDGAVGGLSTADFPHTMPIATWVDFLLHPERHSYDRAEVYPDGSKVEVTGIEVGSADGPSMPLPTESVIAGNTMPQFFDFAVALTGQWFGEGSWCDSAFKALDDVRWRCDDDLGKLTGGFEDLREHWQDRPTSGRASTSGRSATSSRTTPRSPRNCPRCCSPTPA